MPLTLDDDSNNDKINNNNNDNNFVIPQKPDDLSIEEKIITDYIDNEELIGKWYLISATWFRTWKEYVTKETEDPPSIIDNSDILKPPELTSKVDTNGLSLIKENSQEEIDYMLLPEKAWLSLQLWYKGGPEIFRYVIEEGNKKVKRVEVFLKKVIIIKFKNKKEQIEVHRSKYSTLKSLLKDGCKLLGSLNEESTLIFGAIDENTLEAYENLDSTLDDVQIIDNQKVYFGTKEEYHSFSKSSNGKWKKYFTSLFLKLKTTSSVVSSVATTMSVPQMLGGGAPSSPGVCGLGNLGNTCFMNSALQCLIHTSPLSKYFISDAFKDEINREAKLGMNGVLAEQYAILVKAAWSGNYSYLSPRNLKWTIGKFAPRFSGYQQQDSQELLAFLLDGLHEDLNRIVNKPFIEYKDKNLSDEELAIDYWNRHMQREQSIIIDLFQAQFKNTLKCPKCDKVSVSFDPYMYLSLPLPLPSITLEISVFFYDNLEIPKKYGIRIQRTCRVSELLERLGELCDMNGENLLLIESERKRVSKIHNPMNIVPNRGGGRDETYFYCHPIPPNAKDLIRVNLLLRRREENSLPLLGIPYIVYVWPTITFKQFYFLIWKRIQRLIIEEFKDKRFDNAPREDANNIQILIDYVKSESKRNFKLKNLPFTILHVSPYGSLCGICKASAVAKRCYGCEINKENFVLINEISNLALHWKDEFAHYYNFDLGSSVRMDASVKQIREENNQNRSSVVNLSDCIEMFSKTETLGENDQWFCPVCKDHVCAFKKMQLWNTPDILIIHLKRFQATRNGFREKISITVDCPLKRLDLSRYVLSKNGKTPIYNLFAVSNHHGGLNGGHYTAYATVDGKWFDFNDSQARPTNDNIVTSAAYLLFYQRVVD